MLRQVFLNLAINACQAMTRGRSGSWRRRHRADASKCGWRITGSGIAPEHLSRIFDLYFTAKERGTGIGLSMVTASFRCTTARSKCNDSGARHDLPCAAAAGTRILKCHESFATGVLRADVGGVRGRMRVEARRRCPMGRRWRCRSRRACLP